MFHSDLPSTSTSTSAPSPSLPSIPPLDLSPIALEALLKELALALAGNLPPGLSGPAKGAVEIMSGLLSIVSEMLRAAEGLLLPPREQQEAGRLTQSLRDVFIREALINEKLIALRAVASEGNVSEDELLSLRAIAQRLWKQYEQLESMGMRILKELNGLMGAVFPHLQLPTIEHMERQQQLIMQTVRTFFSIILNPSP